MCLFLQVIHHVLESCGNDIDFAIRSLTSLRIASPPETISDAQPPSPSNLEPAQSCGPQEAENSSMSGGAWVDLVVQEMASAADLPDARRRAANVLAAFERDVQQRCVAAQEKETNEVRSQKTLSAY